MSKTDGGSDWFVECLDTQIGLMSLSYVLVSSVVDLFGLYLNFMSFSRMGNALAVHNKFGVMVLSTNEWSSHFFTKKRYILVYQEIINWKPCQIIFQKIEN